MKISVITACYNSAATITDCLNSVQSQTYSDLEHVIVDGASSDATMELVRQLAGPSTMYLSEPDTGIYDALNKGIERVTGDVIGFLHADDQFETDQVLEDIAGIMANSEVDACYSDLVYVQRENPETVVRFWRSSCFKKGMFVRGWMPPHPTVYIRKSVYQELGNFNKDLNIGADWDLLVRFFELGGINAVYQPKVWVRMRLGGTSNRSFANVACNNWQTWRQSCRYFGFLPSLQFPPRKWLHRLKQFN